MYTLNQQILITYRHSIVHVKVRVAGFFVYRELPCLINVRFGRQSL